ncbi:hypothetical protein SLEP1_g19061 [Rubroshorea leprosula]|nr:hypothetical protein SLEP1_g19061 [Rubroshorea leprosula]
MLKPHPNVQATDDHYICSLAFAIPTILSIFLAIVGATPSRFTSSSVRNSAIPLFFFSDLELLILVRL